MRLHGLVRAATTAAALVVVLASAGPARAYVRATEQHSQLPTFWTSSCEIVTIYTNGFTQMTTDEVAKSIAAAAHAWSPELVTCPKRANLDAGSGHPSFEIITQLASGGAVPSVGPDGKNVVIFQTESWDYYADAIALTHRSTDPSGRIFDADIEVNAATIDFVWANLDPNSPPARGGQDQIDLQAAITHEFGHFLGLAHTCFDLGPDGETQSVDDQGQPSPNCPDGNAQQRAAVMWYFVERGVLGTTKRVVTTDDARGVCGIYPPTATPPVCAADLPEDGCGCRTSGRGGAPSAVLVTMTALVGARRRRRSRVQRGRERSVVL
jgi:hypothetical protein